MYGATLKCGGNSPVGKDGIENQQGIFYGYGTNDNYIKNITLLGGTLIGLRQSNNWDVQTTYELGDDIIQFSFVDGITVRDSIMKESGQDALEIKSCKNVLVQNNFFENIADAGVEIRGEGQYVVKDNKFLRVRNALFMKGHEEYLHKIPRNVVFENNYCETNFSAIIFHYSEDIAIRNNTLIKLDELTEAQIGYNACAIDTEYPPVLGETNDIKNIEISGNIIKDFTTGHGLKIKRQTNANVVTGIKIYDNRINNCLCGIYCDGESSIYNNTLTNILGTLDSTYTIKCDNVPINDICLIDSNKLIDVFCNMYIKANKAKIFNNLHKGTGRFVTLENCIDAVVSENYSTCDLFLKLIDSTNISVLSNTVKVANTFLRCEANNISIKNNNIIKITNNSEYTIGLKGANNIVINNNIEHVGVNPPIELEALSINGIVSNNKINSIGTSSCIRVYGQRVIVVGNNTKGGNQGIRIYANECVVNSNICENANFQGIHIMSGATKNLISANISLSNTTNISDEGTANILINNITA